MAPKVVFSYSDTDVQGLHLDEFLDPPLVVFTPGEGPTQPLYLRFPLRARKVVAFDSPATIDVVLSSPATTLLEEDSKVTTVLELDGRAETILTLFSPVTQIVERSSPAC